MFDRQYIRKFANQYAAIDILDVVDSTNNYAAKQVKEHNFRTYACLAMQQTQGRGRYQKSWFSPVGNIYLSVAVPVVSVASLAGLSLAVGVILAQVLEDKYNLTSVELKWPNDIVRDSRKLAGILIDIITPESYVIVGIGLNIAMPDNQVITQPWISLQQLVAKLPNLNKLVVDILRGLHDGLLLFFDKGFSSFKDAWIARNFFKDGFITVIDGKTPILKGKCLGVNDVAALLVDTGHTVVTVDNSNFSLRRIDDIRY